MKSNRIQVLFAVLLFLVTGCAKAAPTGATGSSSSPPPAGETRARVVSAEIGLRVERVDDAVASIRDEVERENGWVADATLVGDRDARSAHLDVRVPAHDVKRLRLALGKLGDVTGDAEHVTDV